MEIVFIYRVMVMFVGVSYRWCYDRLCLGLLYRLISGSSISVYVIEMVIRVELDWLDELLNLFFVVYVVVMSMFVFVS